MVIFSKLKNKKRVFITWIIVSLISLSSFSNKWASSRVYLPLDKGNFWIYDCILGKMRVEMSTSSDRREYTYSAKTRGVWAEEYLIVTDVGVFCKQTFERFLFHKRKVVYDPIQMRIKFPLEEGQEWKWQGFLLEDGERIAGEMTAKVHGEEYVTAPAGRFKCIRVVLDFHYEVRPDRCVTQWFAPSVGMVKGESLIKGKMKGLWGIIQKILGINHFIIELRSWHVKGQQFNLPR